MDNETETGIIQWFNGSMVVEVCGSRSRGPWGKSSRGPVGLWRNRVQISHQLPCGIRVCPYRLLRSSYGVSIAFR